MINLFTEAGLDRLAAKTRTLLKTIGYSVRNERLSRLLKAKGLRLSAGNRFLFDDAIIDELVSLQKERSAKKSPAPRETPPRRDKLVYRTGFGNLASKYYDYPSKRQLTGRKEYLVELTKFAHMEEKIASIGNPLSVTDVPPETAAIDSFLTMSRLTDKTGHHIEPYSAALVKYLAELSEVFLGAGCENTFIDHCNCINPILRLEERTAQVMLERAKYNVTSLITSMPTAGGNAPVTLDGAVILGAAEIVGGLIISCLINPECELRGYISSGVMDFRTATTSQSTPETVLIDCGVVQLMEHAFGGTTGIGGTTYVAATHPGFKAVFEKMFKMNAYQRILGSSGYGGNGILDNGSLISPEQIVIDMEIGESLASIGRIPVNDDSIEAVIAEVVQKGNADFLSNDHTLARYKGAFWEPMLFLRGSVTSEHAILEKAHETFRQRVDSYKEYEYDAERIRTGEQILDRAKAELVS